MRIRSNIYEKIDITVTEKKINELGEEETCINLIDATLPPEVAKQLYIELGNSCCYDEKSNPILKEIIDDYYNHQTINIDYINVKFDCNFIAKMNNELNNNKERNL